MVNTKRLPILALPPPLVMLPGNRATISLSKSMGDALKPLMKDSDPDGKLVAVMPLISTPGYPSREKFNEWGVSARLQRLVQLPPDSLTSQSYLVDMHAVNRIRLFEPFPDVPSPLSIFKHSVHVYSEPTTLPPAQAIEDFKAAAARLVAGTRYSGLSRYAQVIQNIEHAKSAWLADILIAIVQTDSAARLEYLALQDPALRLEHATAVLNRLAEFSAVSNPLNKQQKESLLRQQIAVLQRELHALLGTTEPTDEEEEEDGFEMLKKKFDRMQRGSEERKMAMREWKRLKRIPQGSMEHGVIRSYLEWLASLPWPNVSASDGIKMVENTPHLSTHEFLAKARAQLDADHFGLEKVKKRLIEYLAVVRLKENAAASLAMKGDGPKEPSPGRSKGVKGPILLFVGAPGTGKTSLGQSIAKALGRPFQRISLGGVRDEAEIRGHRRTYVASSPGLIVQALRKAGRLDPVFLLDEIDKVAQSNYHGDPSAALLEVLDPEQNHSFNDHYINVPIDLSQVLFICTANSLAGMPAPLIDRCEAIKLAGYTREEKLHIARHYLLPKQLSGNGLSEAQVEIGDATLRQILEGYTREAGVRGLERAIGAVVRAKAVEWADLDKASATGGALKEGASEPASLPWSEYKRVVEPHEIEGILGVSMWDAAAERDLEPRRGVVYGLVVTGDGEGMILPVESLAVPGTGKLKLTGSLGEVLKESGALALSWVQRHAFALGITDSPAANALGSDVHVHLPAGAQKKDGPSAGVAMVCALVSLLKGVCVPTDVAMTGEITLRGRVTPVGGIKEKVLGAHRAHMKMVILPSANQREVEHDVPPEIRNSMQFVFVRTIEEALEAAFGKDVLAWRPEAPIMMESRL